MTRANNLPNWYEASLPARERKMRGHFSTPSPLVEDILDACGYTPDRDLSQLRVLDPACGSGNFLTGAAKRLMAFGQRAKHSEQVIATSIQRNIWGFDPDPVACFLAEMHLHATYTNTVPYQRRVHIHQADALTLRWDANTNIDLFLANPPYLAAKNNDLSSYRTMQGHGQIDSYLLFVQLALRVTRPHGWIGLVLPDPLLARINAHQTRQCLLAETTIHHLWHLAGVFTAGVGAVVIVAQKCTPKRFHAISWQRESWSTFLTRRVNQPSSILDGHPPLPAGASRAKFVAQSLLLNQPHAELRYLLTEASGTLVERLHTQFLTVGTVPCTCPHTMQKDTIGTVPCTCPHTMQKDTIGTVPCACPHAMQKDTVGTVPCACPHLRPLADFVVIRRGEEIGKNHPLLKQELPPDALASQPEGSAHWHPVLRGGIDIKPYSPPIAQHWIPHTAIHKPLEYYFRPKLLIIKSMDRLQATLDLHNHVVLQTLYMLHLRTQHPTQGKQATHEKIQQEDDELYFLLALLNSRLLQEYVYILHTAYKWVQPQIEQHVLAQLPIPILEDTYEKAQIIRRARLLMQACKEKEADLALQREYNELYEEQERAICMLYTLALTDTNFPNPVEEQVS